MSKRSLEASALNALWKLLSWLELPLLVPWDVKWCPVERFRFYRGIAPALPAFSAVFLAWAVAEREFPYVVVGWIVLGLSVLVARAIVLTGFSGEVPEIAEYWMKYEREHPTDARLLWLPLVLGLIYTTLIASYPQAPMWPIAATVVFGVVLYVGERHAERHEEILRSRFAFRASQWDGRQEVTKEVACYLRARADESLEGCRDVVPEGYIERVNERYAQLINDSPARRDLKALPTDTPPG